MNNTNADITFQYKFSDFHLTAFLICEHAILEKIEVVDKEKQRCLFILRSKEELELIIKDYFNDKLLINPQKFKDKIISLKSLLHETKDKLKLDECKDRREYESRFNKIT